MKRLSTILWRLALSIRTVVVLLAISVFIYMCHTKFGKTPSGDRLFRIPNSSNYKNGAFQNLTDTPAYAPGYTYRDEPLTKIPELNRSSDVVLATPKIGEAVEVGNMDQKFEKWWEK